MAQDAVATMVPIARRAPLHNLSLFKAAHLLTEGGGGCGRYALCSLIPKNIRARFGMVSSDSVEKLCFVIGSMRRETAFRVGLHVSSCKVKVTI